MNVVVVTWDGGSNRQPFEVLCGALTARGDNVLVISHDAHRSMYEGLGATFQPLRVGDKEPGHRTASDAEDMQRVNGVWLSSRIAHSVRSTLAAGTFDVALVDVTMLSAISACEAAGVPLVLVHHTFPGAFWGGPRSGRLAGFVEPLNKVRAELGISTVSTYGELIMHARAHIAPTVAALDLSVQWPVPLHYVGPLQPTAGPADLTELPQRFVLVAFSTTWQRQVATVQCVVDALGGLDRPVVVTTGPVVDPSEIAAAPNTTVIQHVPHSQILDQVDLVITHAGHGTVMSTLAAGVPMVCMPMGRDQHAVAARVAAVGAGIVVAADAQPQPILAAVQRVLDDETFRDAALDVARAIARAPGVAGAIAVIDHAASR
jgi:UDP:flavonoid glycosyltransferase YjiC (YdhE family)